VSLVRLPLYSESPNGSVERHSEERSVEALPKVKSASEEFVGTKGPKVVLVEIKKGMCHTSTSNSFSLALAKNE